MKRLAAAGALCFLGLVAAVSGQTSQTSGHWVGTWTTASVARMYPPEPTPPTGGAPTSAAVRTVPLPRGRRRDDRRRQGCLTGKAYDGVIDFDAVVRDPQKPAQIFAPYDSGDHLHPSDAGDQAMGNAIDLALFGSRQHWLAAASRRRVSSASVFRKSQPVQMDAHGTPPLMSFRCSARNHHT